MGKKNRERKRDKKIYIRRNVKETYVHKNVICSDIDKYTLAKEKKDVSKENYIKI